MGMRGTYLSWFASLDGGIACFLVRGPDEEMDEEKEREETGSTETESLAE